MIALSNQSRFEVLFTQAQRSAAQSAAGGDVSAYDGQMVAVNVNSYTDGTHDFTLMTSDDGNTWSEADENIADSLSVTEAADTGVHYLDFTGSAPYLGVKCDTSGTTDGATWGAYLVAGNASEQPVR